MEHTSARIKRDGMGGFLNPPTHPEHTMSVETDLQRRRDNRGNMSLSYAAECESIDPAARAEAARILREWEAPPIDSRPVVLWIKRAQAHLNNCYKGEGAEPWGRDLHIHQPARGGAPPRVLGTYPASDTYCSDGQHTIEDHAGVHLIRKYYPDYTPSSEDYVTGCADCGDHLNAHANGEGGECTVIKDQAGYEGARKLGHPAGGQSAEIRSTLCLCPTFTVAHTCESLELTGECTHEEEGRVTVRIRALHNGPENARPPKSH